MKFNIYNDEYVLTEVDTGDKEINCIDVYVLSGHEFICVRYIDGTFEEYVSTYRDLEYGGGYYRIQRQQLKEWIKEGKAEEPIGYTIGEHRLEKFKDDKISMNFNMIKGKTFKKIKKRGNKIMKLSELKEYEIREYGEKRWEELEKSYIYELYNSSAEERIKRLRNYGELIKYINNPTKREQKVVIKQNWRNLQYIDNPSEEIKLYAIKQHGEAIQYIHNPSEELKKEAINCIHTAIKYIENPSEELQLLVVSITYFSLEYLHNPSDKVLKEALRHKNCSIEYILKHVKNDLKEKDK